MELHLSDGGIIKMTWQKWMIGMVIGMSAWLGGRTPTVLAARKVAARPVVQSSRTGIPVRTRQRALQLKVVPTNHRQRLTVARPASTDRPAQTVRRAPAPQKNKARQPVKSGPSKPENGRKSRPAPIVVTRPAKKTNNVQRTKRTTPTLLPLVGNGRYTKGRVTFAPTRAYLETNGMQQTPSTLTHAAGYRDHYNFKTALYLPMAIRGRDLHDPQSATFSKDNRYLFVLCVDGAEVSDQYQSGCVVRYDWAKLMRLGAGRTGRMAMLRKAALDATLGRTTKFDREVLACVKVGPIFDTGHAQSLSLDPATNQLWFIQGGGVLKRLDPNTLLPNATVRATSRVGNVLAFDDQGNAYFWIHNENPDSKLPLGAVLLYRGSVSPRGANFKVVPQGLATDPGYFAQSMGYSDATKRLYLVSDDSITSVPIASLGHLKADQVGENTFAAHREFEGLFFMHNATNGYLLTNRGTEVMQLES